MNAARFFRFFFEIRVFSMKLTASLSLLEKMIRLLFGAISALVFRGNLLLASGSVPWLFWGIPNIFHPTSSLDTLTSCGSLKKNHPHKLGLKTMGYKQKWSDFTPYKDGLLNGVHGGLFNQSGAHHALGERPWEVGERVLNDFMNDLDCYLDGSGVRGSPGRSGCEIFTTLGIYFNLDVKGFTRWWLQWFFMFAPTWEDDPTWLIFFQWVETTN